MLTVKKQPHNSVLIKASSQKELAKTFMRFQEHYESPVFKNKVFTCGQFKEWYSTTYGADTYAQDWSGFNFPSSVLLPFKKGLFDPLTKEEKSLLKLFKYRHDEFYIIGAQDSSVLKHELTHALYFSNLEYRKNIDEIFLKHHKELSKVIRYIINKGYHKDVVYDELQAYISDNDNEFIISNTPKTVLNSVNKFHSKYYKKGKK
jgi:hypothetical protein